MSQRVSVGVPAASSLSSSLCVFPGGFSLLTETGRLRPYLVLDTGEDHRVPAAAVAAPEVVAAASVHLSSPSPQGLFPVDEDVPVDHSWSRDGRVLVVLRRSSFTVYHCYRDFQRRRSGSNDENGVGRRRRQGQARPLQSVVGPSLGLEEVHTGRTDFGGKVVACCSISAPAAAATPPPAAAPAGSALSSSGGADDRPTYLIAIGGTYGIECHAVEVSATPRSSSADTTTATMTKDKQQDVQQQPARDPLPGKSEPLQGQALTTDMEEAVQPAAAAATAAAAAAAAAAATATCLPLTTLFRGYPVVALACSPDSSLMAAAAMTGHVSVWDVASIAAPAQQQEVAAPTRREPVKRGRGDKKKGLEGVLSATRPPRQIDSPGTAALWGVALPMARATSLSFSSTDSATFALACWDGAVAVFTPTPATAASASPLPGRTSPSLVETHPGRRGGGESASGVGNRAWEPVWREKPALVKAGGGKGVSLEDQDGAFLCWCRGPDSNDTADLAVSAYGVTADACICCEHRDHALSGVQGPTGCGDRLHGPDGCGEKGPGFELFTGGLGERVGGMLAGSRPPGVAEPTAGRYLIHGLAAGPNFVALYDSDLCLHVVSLAAVLSAGNVLPPPSCRNPAAEAAGESVQEAAAHPTRDTMQSRLDVAATEGESSPSNTKVTLVSNDHGLAVADVGRHRNSGGQGFDSSAPAEDGLKLSVTWRNATTGEETPDDGECAGGAGESDPRMPFLPAQLAGDEEDDVHGGVFGADVRWGRLALFTRYTVLVYTRPDEEIEATGKAPEAEAESLSGAPSLAGGWRAYADFPIVHGVLLGGASTAAPRSRRLPNAPADMGGLHLVTVLATDGDGPGPAVTVRSLSDRKLACRRALRTTESDDKEAGVEARGVKVYASPGYAGSGVFVVAAEGAEGECALIWRASFDEATCQLELTPPRVITSSPWPEPETLRLAGVAGPNCELILFKEVSDTHPDESAGDRNVRWWVTWPEVEIWRCVEAPVLLGDEELGVADFVKIFQLEVEEMMVSRPAAGAAERVDEGGSQLQK